MKNIPDGISASGLITTVNENFSTLGGLAIYGYRPEGTAGLVLGYYGGYWGDDLIDDDTIELTANSTNYVVRDRSSGEISASTDTTDWDDTDGFSHIGIGVTGASTITSWTDRRAGPGGLFSSGGGSALADGDYGDIVVGSSGAAMSIDSDVLSAFGRTLIDDADAAAARTTLGLGTAAVANTGTASGNVPVLDGSGRLDTAIVPSVAITDVYTVASQAAMLALTAEKGDIAIRSDLNKSFALATNSPTTLADWKELLTPTDAVLSVASLTGAISASALRTALGLVIGTDVLAYDADLATIAGLTATTDNFLQAKAGAWASRTIAQVVADLQGTGLVVTQAGYRGIPSSSHSANYTAVAADAGTSLDHPASDANNRTFTIPSNASVAFEVGTCLSFSNMSVNPLTIAINSDTLYLVGTGDTSSRTLAQFGMCTARKMTATTWLISGPGLT